MILYLYFLFRRIVLLASWSGRSTWTFISHGPLYSTCKMYSLSAPDGFIHVGQGQERDSYFDVATDYYVVAILWISVSLCLIGPK